MTAEASAKRMELPTYFDSLLQRSPITTNDITVFLREMRRTPSGPLITSKLLAGKIQSTSETNALHAFDFLEAALDAEVEGAIEFRTEVGRYRFLNEIIRVLSPKYLGDQTASSVKERAARFLTDAAGCKRRRWFPSAHSKIDAVYGSLVESGIIQKVSDESAMDPDAEFKKSIFERGENAILLKKLLQSKNPADLQAANRLIKNLVDEEAKRNERRTELHSLIDRIETSTSLLIEMLSQSRIDKEIVDELASTCQSLRNKLGGIGAETNDETTSLLQASDNIEKALEFYDRRKNSTPSVEEKEHAEVTIDQDKISGLAGHSDPGLSLADELLMGMDLGLPLAPSMDMSGGDRLESSASNLLNLDVELLSGVQKTESSEQDISAKNLVFDEISRMSRELMDKSLIGFKNNSSSVISDSKRTDRRPMCELKKNTEKRTVAEPSDASLNTQFSLLDLDFLENSDSNKTKNTPSPQCQIVNSSQVNTSLEDDNLLLVFESNSKLRHSDADAILRTESDQSQKAAKSNASTTSQVESANVLPNFALSTIRELDMDRIDFVNMSPLKIEVDSNALVGLTLSFGSFPEFPSTVKIAVIAVTNQSSSASFLNYVFQLLPPKGVQVKLLPPSCTELPPWKKRFLPPPALTQVALILIPPSDSMTRLRYILSYCLEDETALQNGDFELPLF